MDENTRFIIERMDDLEQRLMARIDVLEAWRNRVIGLGVVAGGIGSLIMEIVLKKLP